MITQQDSPVQSSLGLGKHTQLLKMSFELSDEGRAGRTKSDLICLSPALESTLLAGYKHVRLSTDDGSSIPRPRNAL